MNTKNESKELNYKDLLGRIVGMEMILNVWNMKELFYNETKN